MLKEEILKTQKEKEYAEDQKRFSDQLMAIRNKRSFDEYNQSEQIMNINVDQQGQFLANSWSPYRPDLNTTDQVFIRSSSKQSFFFFY